MWLTPTIAAGTNPVTLQEAKRQVHAEDFTDDDAYLTSLLAAALDHVEGYCGAQFAVRTFEAKATTWADLCRLPLTPVSEPVLTYVDTGGNAATIDANAYELRDSEIVLKPGNAWPAVQYGSLITLAGKTGFADCPPAVRHAMLLWLDDAYDNRGSAASPEWTTMDALLCNHRYYS